VGEVGFAQLSSPMLLNKVHFLRRTFARPPLLDPALQSPQLSIRKTLWILPLQRREDRFRLQPGIRPDLLSDHRPGSGKSILSRPPVPIRFHFAWQPPSPEVFPRRLHVHARLRRRYLLPILNVRQFVQPPYLLVCHHAESALRNNCRQHGTLIVADQKTMPLRKTVAVFGCS
jgi:hypothetical protein